MSSPRRNVVPFFFFNDTATTEIYTLSLHDALPICITNSGGNLALHLVGNLQYFLGTVLGGTGYVRDRDAEFGRRDVPRAELLRQIDTALAAVAQTMALLREQDLAKPYPQPVGGVTLSTGDFLLHLAAHFTYHLGQVDYHRRLLTGKAGQIRAVPLTELASAAPAPKS